MGEHQRTRIGAETEEGGLAEGEDAGIAPEQIDGQRQRGQQQRTDQDIDDVDVQEEGRNAEDHERGHAGLEYGSDVRAPLGRRDRTLGGAVSRPLNH